MVRSQRPWYRSARSLRRQQGRCRNRAGGVRTISELGTRATTASKDRLDSSPASTAGTDLTEAPPAVALRLSATSSRARTANRLLPAFGVWFFRGLLVIPFVFMAPEVISLVLGRPGSAANVSASTADVL